MTKGDIRKIGYNILVRDADEPEGVVSRLNEGDLAVMIERCPRFAKHWDCITRIGLVTLDKSVLSDIKGMKRGKL